MDENETLEVNKDDFVEQEEQEESVDNEPSEMELTARSMGWKPEEEYEGPEGEWIDAEEFVGRAPLYKNLNKQKRHIKRLEKAISELADHNRRIAQATKEQHLEDLKAARKAARDEGNHDAIDDIDEQIKQTEAARIPEEVNYVFQEWLDDNQWYQEDPDMAAIANSYGARLKQTNPNIDDQEALDKVRQHVMKKFPDSEYFEDERPAKKQNVRVPDGGGRGKRRSNSSTYNPTPEERKMAREFVELGVFDSEAEYYKQLKGAK